MRVLVIEDDPISVDVASDGEQGLELAHLTQPDVILLDVMMPKVDGWAASGTLQQDPDLASVPIVCVRGLRAMSSGSPPSTEAMQHTT